ncbi:hypothetical protein ACJZ2D_015528 [Fusarium nematophilum]
MAPVTLSQPKDRALNGGDLLAQCLRALDVEVAFGLGGGHLDAFLLGCEENNIRLIDTRHETVSVQAAEGYYRVTGKVGVSFVTANSGFSNALPGLASALADKNGICVLTSSQPQKDIDTNGLQGAHDQILVAKPITKFAHRVVRGTEIPRVVAHAFRVAAAGGPGPVLVDVPLDVMVAPVDQESISWGALADPPTYPPGPNEDAVEALVQLWRNAKRPAIIAEIISRGNKSTSLERLAEISSTPVFHNLNYGPAIPYQHPLQAGPSNQLSRLSASSSQPDLIILLGVRPSTFTGGRGGLVLPKEGCKIVQIDADGHEIGKHHRVDLGLISDPEQAILALNRRLEGSQLTAQEDWMQLATGLKSQPLKNFEAEPASSSAGLNPFHAVKELFSSAKPGAIVCSDGGESSYWGIDLAPYNNAHLVMYACGITGFLGNGWGYALGAAVADPSRQVINIQGDGSAGFHIAELDTYARFKLNILTVVVNNSLWGMSWHAQEMNYADKIKNRPVSLLSAGTSYHAVARGFENAAARVTRIEDIGPTVKMLSASKGPALIDLVVSEAPVHPGLTSLVRGNSDPAFPPYFG